MIGSIFRCKKLFLLVVIIIGALVYTFLNKDFLNKRTEQSFAKRANTQVHFEFKNIPKRDDEKDISHHQTNTNTKEDYEFSEKNLIDPKRLISELSPDNKETKTDVEWETGDENDETQEGSDGEVHDIPGPHHFPLPENTNIAHEQYTPANIQRNNNSQAKLEKNGSKNHELEIASKELPRPYETDVAHKKSPENSQQTNINFNNEYAEGFKGENQKFKQEKRELSENQVLQFDDHGNLSDKRQAFNKINEHENHSAIIKVSAINVTKVIQNADRSQQEPERQHHKIERNRDTKQKPKGILQRLLNDIHDDNIPPYTICPFLGLRKKTKLKHQTAKCKPKVWDETSCKEAYVLYEIDQQPLKCDKLQGKEEVCRYNPHGSLHCNISVCGDKYIQLSSLDPNYGIVRNKDSKIFIETNQELVQLLYDYSDVNKENGFNFCFLKCNSRSKVHPNIEQLVMFPPVIRKNPALEPPLINVNIIVLDSVSRPHFYRSLQKSVRTFRKIVHDPKIKATVLDFELFQSMASYTFHNIRVFMSGKTDFKYKEHKDQHYEIEHLFKNLKSKGYHTLLQEDSCWYDEWGSLYTDNLFQGKQPVTLNDFKNRWDNFKSKTKKYYIDDYGLSHFSCEALKRYNITNQFNQPKKICFGGKVFAVHFLDYLERVYNENINSKRPIFSYTHLNTGHEISGTRIKQLDERLAVFFDNMAHKENTLTLVFSDHGPKTTKYAFRTMSGRGEIYDALMFLILPEKVASLLGYERTKALITNQQRLITAFDLHQTFMSIDEVGINSKRKWGIFREISPNRTCSDLPIKFSAVCKCHGWDKNFPVNHPPLVWIAELALGAINNKIQNHYTGGIDSEGGFGNCQRLTGKRFEKIRRHSVGSRYQVTMDLIVDPDSEIFEIQVEYPKKPRRSRNNVTITSISRISIYRRFEKCKDENVDLTLCVCKSRKKSSSRRWLAMNTRKNLLLILSRNKHFGAEVKFTDLHAACLIMITRTHSPRTSAFEIANACTNRLYRVKVTGKSRGKTLTSTTFPITLQVKPLTAHFLFSVYHLEKPYGFKATTSYKAYFF